MKKLALLLTLIPVLCAPAALADDSEQNTADEPTFQIFEAATSDQFFVFTRPNQVQRYFVSCSDATTLSARVAATGVAGNRWQVTVRIWDRFPEEAVAVASGALNAFSPTATVRTHGGTPLRALVEVRYLHGRNQFNATGTLRLSTNGTCTPAITTIGLSDF